MKNLLAQFSKFISIGFVIFSLLTGLSTLIAIAPKDIFQDKIELPPKPTVVKLAETPPPAEPPPVQKTQSLMASLAPPSFSNLDLGSGVSFGSAGSGPAVGGSGGFGTDASLLAQEKSNLNRPPKLSLKGSLEYPSEARQRNISGYVILKILISETGLVSQVEVQESDPPGIFDQSAMKSIKNWKFEPAMVQGKLTSAWTAQKIKFELN